MRSTDGGKVTAAVGRARVVDVAALARQVLGDTNQARAWLDAPHPLFGENPPIKIALTDAGARQVVRILHNIEYDLPV